MQKSDYDTCLKTHATLRIYSDKIQPSIISKMLHIKPTASQLIGDFMYPNKKNSPIIKLNGWFLSSENKINSYDSRKHIDWISKKIGKMISELLVLQNMGCRMDISCYWLSKNGHGGPTISKKQSDFLGNANIDLWYDVYFIGD